MNDWVSGVYETGGTHQYPKSAPIGETVLNKQEMQNEYVKWRNSQTSLMDSGKESTQNYDEWIAKAQDAHTRREVAKELKQFKLPVKAFFSQPMQEQWDVLIRRLERK
jgi:chemotaxis regulatin CheY-phosphate phosphatase CheZ